MECHWTGVNELAHKGFSLVSLLCSSWLWRASPGLRVHCSPQCVPPWWAWSNELVEKKQVYQTAWAECGFSGGKGTNIDLCAVGPLGEDTEVSCNRYTAEHGPPLLLAADNLFYLLFVQWPPYSHSSPLSASLFFFRILLVIFSHSQGYNCYHQWPPYLYPQLSSL